MCDRHADRECPDETFLGMEHGRQLRSSWLGIRSLGRRGLGQGRLDNIEGLRGPCNSVSPFPERKVRERRSAGACRSRTGIGKKAGLADILSSIQPKQPSAEEDVKAPPAEPTDEEIHGIDVLEIEDAVKALWKEGIYAESSMGCTGPVIKMAASRIEKAKAVLKENGYI